MKDRISETVITHVMEPVLPGTYSVLTVGGAQDTTRVFAFRINNAPAQTPGFAHRQRAGKSLELPIVQRTDEVLTVDVPAGPYGLIAFHTTNRFETGAAWIANRPRIDWSDYSEAACGTPFRLIGRNFVAANQYPPLNSKTPRSFGGLLKGKTKCVAQPVSGGRSRYYSIPVVQSSCYEAHLEIPRNLEPGEYHLFLHNGLGGPLGWSEPFRVTVQCQAIWPDRVFRVDDYLDQMHNVDDAISAALKAAQKNGGGIVEFAAKIYPITRTLFVPPRTVVRGAGRDRTLIHLPTGEGPKPPYVAIAGDRDFIVEDLRIQSVHSLVLICAPSSAVTSLERGLGTEEPFAEHPAHKEGEAFEDMAPERVTQFGRHRARNVTVRRCHLVQHILGGRMRRKDQKNLDRVVEYMLTGRHAQGGYNSILIRGENITIRDNWIHAASNGIFLQQTAHAVISGNRVSVGASGTGIVGDGKLVWPKDFPKGGGAKIIGSYSHDLLIEDNEILGHSEFTRNLIMIYAGSENIHFARNHLHDIPPTTDGESFLTHLWPARWMKPRIRMTGPTTGRIIDPEGEVTHECLEGAFIDVVDGKGIGQLQRVIKRKEDRFEIEKPWIFAPDGTSRIVFSAPPPFRNMTLIDNRLSESPINIILYGYTHDVVIDGNHVSDGPGITLWSLRIEAAQKVWGGLAYTSIINNRTERDWTTVAGGEDSTIPFGIIFIGSNYRGVVEGYDILGLVIRNNRMTNNSGLRLKLTFPSGFEGIPWHVRDYGMVIERNHCEDSHIGMAIEKGAKVALRNNSSRNVAHPVKWVDPVEWQDQSI
jgi:hypothetical protein